ncbi:hypothetical protein E2493_07340 [Sphingomonas parva]|uniref:YNCE-like beta-propeller domain-containing protein n=1 Tax=Sphingomonas parva TaxID=2555898 RepID=A0A4Y8ZS85_9SPHN|nr:PQQ-dependent catabolism-associated beta-propeller protein [Sphingomonas parva]TFI58873.1 hypothetical protein E2493_07340 [Sphingomonas parva]
MRPLLFLALGCGAPAAAETIWVSNEAADRIHLIDAATLKEKGQIAVGAGPRGIVAAPDGRSVYVAVSKDNRIAVVDIATAKVTGYLPSGPDPETFALSPDGKTLFAANEDDNALSIVDVVDARLRQEVMVGGEPEGTAVSPDGKLVVQTSESASMAHLIDAASGEVTDNLLVDTRPRFVAFTPDGRHFWVSSEVRGTVTVFDTATRKQVGKIDFQAADLVTPDADVFVQPVAIAFTREGKRAFVALGRGKLVAEVDPAKLTIVRTFPVGWRAWNLAPSPDERRLYTANGLSEDLTAIDLDANRVIDSVKLGGRPWGVAVTR